MSALSAPAALADPSDARGVAAPRTEAPAAPRILFIDNVRWVMILLVLSMHAAVTYSPVGSWYYREHPALGPASTLFFVTYQAVLQGFFMALLFFVAGVFTPAAFDAKGAGGFIRGRLVRLGLPTLFFVALLGPVTEYYVAHSWRTPHTFAHEMGLYLIRGRFLGGTGPLWFCAALLIFSLAYAGLRSLLVARALRPSRVTAQGVAIVVLVLAVTTFAVRLAAPLGTSVFNMQLCYFPSYVILFALGVIAARSDWLHTVEDRFAWRVAAICLGAAAVIWLPLLVVGGGLAGKTAPYNGGLHWQSAALSLWESLVCVGMSFAVLTLFRARLTRQGPVTRSLSANAFAVYVIHPPILIGLALAMAKFDMPAVPKFALLWALSAVACFGVAAPIARRIPLLGPILK